MFERYIPAAATTIGCMKIRRRPGWLFMAFPAAMLSFAAHADRPLPPISLCIDGGNCSTDPSQGRKKKWNPGHYIVEDVLDVYNPTHTAELKALGGETKGVALWVSWRALEPTRGNYDFRYLKNAVDTLHAAGLHAIIQVQDRSFGGQVLRAPDYLKTEPGGEGGIYAKYSDKARGTVPKLWKPAIMDRWIALMTALSDEFDAHPAVEGIRGEETDVSFSSDQYAAADFDPEVYFTQLLRLNKELAGIFPHTTVWIGANFMDTQSRLERLVKDAWSKGLGVMGSDLVPGRPSWVERIYTGQHWNGSAWTTLGGHDYRGEVLFEVQIQSPEMGGKAGNFTPAEFHAAALALRVHHLLWERKNYSWDVATYGIAADKQTYWDSSIAGSDTLRVKDWLRGGHREMTLALPPSLFAGT